MSAVMTPPQPNRSVGDYRFNEYAEQVVSGDVVACKWVQLAAKRYLRELDRQRTDDFPFYFDEEEAKMAVDFFPMFLRHHQGDLAGEPLFLEPWQQFIIANIYGWKRVGSGLRRFRKVYISVGRKNGKSLLAGGVGIKGLMLDGEGGPRVVCAATKRAQARIVWDSVAATLEQNPELMQEFGINISKSVNNTVIRLSTGLADFIPLGEDSKTEDGHNIHVGIIDEYHEHPNDKMVGVVQTAMGSRSQPLLFIITTAGFDIQSPAYEEERYLSRILEGVVSDESYFGLLYTLDEEDDWRDPRVWIKANPNLGVGKHFEQIENLITEAENKPSTKQQVLTKELNVWTQGLSTWLDFSVWKKNNAGPFEESSVIGRRCFAALDASMNRDHTVVTYCFPPESSNEKWRYLHRIWVPAESLDQKSSQDGANYVLWRKNGWIEYPGETIVRDYVTSKIIADMQKFDIRELAYDRYGDGQPIALDLEEEGLPVVQFPQSAKEFTAPTNEFERLVVSGDMQHGGNPVMDYYVMSAHLYQGPNDQRKPVKYRQGDDTSRIDGLITSVMATWRALLSDGGKSAYEERGILVL